MAIDWSKYTPVDDTNQPQTDWSKFTPVDSPKLASAKPDEPGFIDSAVRGFKRALPETKSLLYGAGAAVAGGLGFDDLRDSALEKYQEVQKEDVEPLQSGATFAGVLDGTSNFGEWAGDTLGNFGGQALESAAAAGAGALIGGAATAPTGPGAIVGSATGAVGGLVAKSIVKKSVKEYVEDMVSKGVAKEVAETAGQKYAQKLGAATIAGSGLNIGQEVGIGYTQRATDAAASGEELTKTDAGRALAFGIPAGLLDTLAEGLTVGRAARGISGDSSLAKRVLTGAGKGAAMEGSTEAVQSVLERAGADQAITGDEAYSDYLENFAAGALGGTVAGGAGGIKRQVPDGPISRAVLQMPDMEDAPPSTTVVDPVTNKTVVVPTHKPGSLSETASILKSAMPSVEVPSIVEPLAIDQNLTAAEVSVPQESKPAEKIKRSGPEIIDTETGELIKLSEEDVKTRINTMLDAGKVVDVGVVSNAFNMTKRQAADLRRQVQIDRKNQTIAPSVDSELLPVETSSAPSSSVDVGNSEQYTPPVTAAGDSTETTNQLDKVIEADQIPPQDLAAPTISSAQTPTDTLEESRPTQSESPSLQEGSSTQEARPLQASPDAQIEQPKSFGQQAASSELQPQSAVSGVPSAQDTPAVNAVQAQYDESPDVLDTDITTQSGSPFSVIGAAEVAARRVGETARVIPVDGGFVVRQPKAQGAVPNEPAGTTKDESSVVDSSTSIQPTVADVADAQNQSALPTERDTAFTAEENSALAQAGSVAAPLETAAAQAATSPTNEIPQPTDAQKEAGNYKKGHIKLNGLDISIQNPAGTSRRPEWPPLKNHYGYIKGTIGKDKDHVDVFMTDNAHDATLPVFVVDQNNEKGGFDEHKVIMGAATEKEARKAYLSNYAKGWKGMSGVTRMTQEQFKAWVKDPKQTVKRAVAVKKFPASVVKAANNNQENTDGLSIADNTQASTEETSTNKSTAEKGQQSSVLKEYIALGEQQVKQQKAQVAKTIRDGTQLALDEAKKALGSVDITLLQRESLTKRVAELEKQVDGDLRGGIQKAGGQAATDPKDEDEERTDRRNTSERARVDALPDDERDAEIERLRKEIRTDDLTGLFNAKAWRADEAAGTRLPHMALIDLDLFKGYNDLLGYEGADQALKLFGATIAKTNSRGVNYRRGGDEFILTAATPEAIATAVKRLKNLADRVRIRLTDKSGEQMIVTGILHSAGIGTDEQSAAKQLEQIKGTKPSSRTGAQPGNITRDDRVRASKSTPSGVPETEPARQDGNSDLAKQTPPSSGVSISEARRSFSIERYNKEADENITEIFNIGDYVSATLAGEKNLTGKIEGVSHARKKANVRGIWVDFGKIYAAEKPVISEPKKVAMSKAIASVNKVSVLSDADLVGQDKPALEFVKSTLDLLYDGGSTLSEYKSAFASLINNKTDVIDQLGKQTKEKLLDYGNSYFMSRYKSEKKEKIVKEVYELLEYSFALGKSFGPNSYTMSAGGLAKFEADKSAALKELVESQTEESFAKYQAERKAEAAVRNAKREERKSGLAEPKTIQDFENILRLKMADGVDFKAARLSLTPEQRSTFDLLTADQSRPDRLAKKQEAKTNVRIAGQLVSGDVVETKHTKHGHDLFVVQLAERVSREDYDTLNIGAKKLGGSYSSFRGRGAVPGFQFRTKESAEAFTKLAGGDNTEAADIAKTRRDSFDDDKTQSAVERLNEMAERLDDRASDVLTADRKTNTQRRAGQAARIESAANADKALAKTMRNIATAIESGDAKYLDRVRQKVQVELLESMVKRGDDAYLRVLYPDYGKREQHLGKPATIEAADHAEWPAYTAYRSDLAKLARQLMEVDGSKLLGKKLLKVADDVSKPYTDFAKKNLQLLNYFQSKNNLGEVKAAVFGTEDAAYNSIARGGYNGQAIPMQVKRGQYRVIPSPQLAQEKGLWNGDNDARISLTREFASELIEKASKANRRRNNNVSVPWQMESAHADRNALARMGIETPAEFRTALREFIGLRQVAAAEDKVKKLERAMIGVKNDGMDFFPTSREVVAEMISASEIEQGMTVLEPSAGMGHIADALREAGTEPDIGELSGSRRDLLEAKGYNLVSGDFMEFNGSYDRILMNPPFSNRRDAEHVQHAFTLLKPNGRIVAIMGEGVFFGQDKKAQAFRDWLDSVGGTSEKLPEGSFMDPSLPVNTSVSARMVVIDKPDVTLYSNLDPVKNPIGIPVETAVLSKAVSAMTANWKKGPRVVVTDKPLVQNIKAEGFYDPSTQTVSLIAPNIRGNAQMSAMDRALQVLAHEVVGHYGIEAITGPELWGQITATIGKMRQNPKFADLFAEVDRRNKNLKPADIEYVKEAVAVITEKGVRNSVYDRVVAAFRSFFRKLGWLKNFSEAELRQHIVKAARFVADGDQAPADQLDQELAFSNPNRSAFKDAADFAQNIKAFIAGTLPGTAPLTVAEGTPDVYRKLGAFDLPITIKREKINEILKEHPEMNLSVFQQLGRHIHEPVAIFQSKTGEGLVALTEMEADGKPIVAAVHLGVLDGRAKVNRISTVYGRDNTNKIQKWVDEGLLRYIDNTKKPKWLTTTGLQLPNVGPAKGRLLTEQDVVKPFSSGTGYYSNPDSANTRQSSQVVKDIEDILSDDQSKTVLEKAKTWLKDATPAKIKDSFRTTWLGALTTRHLTELGSDYFDGIKYYTEYLAKMGADRNQLQEEGEKVAESSRKWVGKNQDDAKRLFKVMHDATIEGVDPAEDYKVLQFSYNGKLIDATRVNVNEARKAIQQQMRERSGDSKQDMLNELKYLKSLPGIAKRREQTYPSLQARFEAMPAEAKAIYIEFRDLYSKRSEQVEEALIARIKDTDVPQQQQRKVIDLIRKQFETARIQGVYFPLQRFGNYFVSAEKDGEHVYLMFPKQKELEKAVNALKAKDYKINKQGLKVESKKQDAPSGTFVAQVINALGKAKISEETQDQVYQLYLQAMPELSMRKHSIHRQAVVGNDPDALRAFAFNMQHGAHQLAKLRYSHKLTAVLDLLKKSQEFKREQEDADTSKIVAGDAILGELNKRHDWIMNPQDSALTNTISSAGFLYYLGATPAAALVNLTQTAMITYPYLAARFGAIKSMNYLLAAGRDAGKTLGNIQKTLTNPEELRFYEELQKTGALDKTQAHNLAGIAEGGAVGHNPAWAKAMEIIGWGFHKTEVINREASGMAAFRLARAEGIEFDDALKVAIDTINDTHYDYTNQNRARFMQSGTAKVLLMFRQYSLNTTWHLGRMVWQATKGQTPEVKRIARRNLAGVLGMSSMFSGVLGLPTISVVFGVLNALAATFGDDDEPWDAETEFKNFLADMFGAGTARVIGTGVANEITGADIANRVSLSQLWFRDADKELEGSGAYYHLLEQAAGPMGGILKNVLVGKQRIDEGQYWRGIETMLPKGLKDSMKAARYAQEGVNNLRGDPLVHDLSLFQALLQLNGFTPKEVAQRYDENNAVKNYEASIMHRRQRLMDAYAMAVRLDDNATAADVLRKIQNFNKDQPTVAISGKNITSSMRARMRYSQQAENGIVVNKKLQAKLEERITFAGE